MMKNSLHQSKGGLILKACVNKDKKINHVNTLRGSLNVLSNIRIFSPEGGSTGKQRQSSQISNSTAA